MRVRVRGLLAGAGAFLVLASCQTVAPDPVAPPPPPVKQPAVADLGGDPGPSRILPVPPLEVDEIDPILHSVVGRDPRLAERVEYWVGFWTSRGSGHFARYLDRMEIYRGMVDRELADRGLPSSLRFLPIVESGYHHAIVSRAGATGMWQIMPPTARGLGLTVNSLVDDRRDPVTSTRAALDYLQELYGRFDSWFLALAAYNAGPGRVNRILSRYAPDQEMHGDEVYLLLQARFPAETREFVPRFFAAAVLASNPEVFGFSPDRDVAPLAFEEVVVPDAVSLDIAALAAGVEEEELRALNPHYLRGFTPPGEIRTLRVPPGQGELFERNFALIPPEERISFMEHSVARGETLTHIARAYRISVADLSSANGRLDPRRLQIGQRLVIPVAGSRGRAADRLALADRLEAAPPAPGERLPGENPLSVDGDVPVPDTGAGAENEPAQAVAAVEAGPAAGAGPAPEAGPADEPPARRHTVRSGDNLWEIARGYGTTVEELRRMNGLSSSAVLRPGQELSVGSGAGSPGARSHRVSRGDTWGGLARRYGVSVQELARVNGRTTRQVIRVGEVLQIP